MRPLGGSATVSGWPWASRCAFPASLLIPKTWLTVRPMSKTGCEHSRRCKCKMTKTLPGTQEELHTYQLPIPIPLLKYKYQRKCYHLSVNFFKSLPSKLPAFWEGRNLQQGPGRMFRCEALKGRGRTSKASFSSLTITPDANTVWDVRVWVDRINHFD